MPAVSDSRQLPSLGPPVSAWGTNQPGTSVTRNTRRERLGLWSAVALQQHFTDTGGKGGLPVPPPPPSHGRQGLSGSSRGRLGAGYSPAATYPSAADLEEASGRGGTSDLRAHLGPAPSLPGRSQKPTLAQRMGLVPALPPPPSADDWRAVVQRALLREGTSHDPLRVASRDGSSSVCAICQVAYSSTSEEGQIILSCSHVFHARCFRAFERCVRAQQRAEVAGVAEVTAPLACPVCRTQHYQKRVFYEGKALAQRAAIVKVQAVVRGHLARLAYTRVRLERNATFRTRYVQERLARLSAAWDTFCAQQERRRETVLAMLAVQHQAARAACLSEQSWAEIWRKAVFGSISMMTGTAAATVAAAATHGGVTVQCPICIDVIHCTQAPDSYVTQRASPARRLTGEDAVAQIRAAYEARRAARLLAPPTRSRTAQRAPAALVPAAGGQETATAGVSRRKKARKQPLAAAPVMPPSAPVVADSPLSVESGARRVGDLAVAGPHSGVLLSCGHCFHAACLGCYERYNERSAMERGELAGQPGGVSVHRCPICRAGYAKHPL